MLNPRSYTPPPRTQTLPRSRAARELYFSANSDILIVNRREVSLTRILLNASVQHEFEGMYLCNRGDMYNFKRHNAHLQVVILDNNRSLS